jgi:putative ABC transport system substrate-binding protein
MDRRRFLLTSLAGALAAPLAAQAQQEGKVPRIGFLANVPSPGTEAFQKGLQELGYVEGQNIIVEWRLAQGRLERLPELAADLVRVKVDVIVAPTIPYVEAARAATTTIPIVFTTVPDPVRFGFVKSLARPGGNITGLATRGDFGIDGKRLELLKEAVPGLTRVAVLTSTTGAEHSVRELERAAASLGIQRDVVTVDRPEEMEQAFALMKGKRVGAVIEVGSPWFYSHRQLLAGLALRGGFPMSCSSGEAVQAGCLLFYGANLPDLLRRSAQYVHKILMGAKPADLPVEQPTKFDLVINLKTAKALGLTIPPSLLARADQVIE